MFITLKVLIQERRKERKILYRGTNSGLGTVKERISESKGSSETFSQSAGQEEKEKNRKGQLKGAENRLKYTHIYLIEILQEDTGENNSEAVLKSITTENFLEFKER